MADTYSQINIHCVFAVKGRQSLIVNNFRDELHKYISAVLNSHQAFPLAVGGWRDHVHIFFELSPAKTVADIVRDVKAISSKWINESGFIQGKFQWQEGYGAFSHSRSQRHDVIQYIMNQEEHHRIKTFKEEYMDMLEKFEVPFKPEYLFEFYPRK